MTHQIAPLTNPDPGLSTTFARVKVAVQNEAGLTPKTRVNIVSAIARVAQLQGAKGLDATVDIPKLQRKFETLQPAMLGFATRGALAAMRSNFRRGLRIAGVSVMPGKSHTPLSPAWLTLQNLAETTDQWVPLSRFAHFCTERGIEPECVALAHLVTFEAAVRSTSLKSRSDKAQRQVARGWERARKAISTWPQISLELAPKRAPSTLPWSAYPPSLEAEARAFVNRDSSDDIFGSDTRSPLRLSTQANYLGALRRAAGELVNSGTPAYELTGLAKLLEPARVKTVLKRVQARTGRNKGGQISQLAIVFLLAGKYVGLPAPELDQLKSIEKNLRGRREMGDRTLHRLEQLGDEQLDDLLRLPDRLTRLASAHSDVDLRSARLMRAALFLSLLLDTAARQGNIVGLDLDHDVLDHPDGRISIHIAGQKVKNGEPIRSPLRPQTCKLFRLYRETFRHLHAPAGECAWLFPSPSGKHWSQTAANQALQDLTARHIGLAINPHLVRAAASLIIERSHPGAIGIVRDVLGHRTLATTERYYRRARPQASRQAYHAELERQQGKKGGRR